MKPHPENVSTGTIIHEARAIWQRTGALGILPSDREAAILVRAMAAGWDPNMPHPQVPAGDYGRFLKGNPKP